MAVIHLVLADPDGDYLEKLGRYLLKHKQNPFELELFTNREALNGWFESGGTADLIGISENFGNDAVSAEGIGNRVLLCEEALNSGRNRIFKYQPLDVLMRELLACCADVVKPVVPAGRGGGRMLLVLSVDGCESFNPLAPALAAAYGREHGKVFYLNLDPLGATSLFFQTGQTRGLTEMLYYIKSGKENLPLRVEACTSHDANWGVDYFLAPLNPRDLFELKASECESLVQAVLGRGTYDWLIVYRDLRGDEPEQKLLELAESICVAGTDNPVSRYRIKKWLEALEQTQTKSDEGLKSKIQPVLAAMSHSPQNTEESRLGDSEILALPWYRESPDTPGSSFRGDGGPLAGGSDYLRAVKSAFAGFMGLNCDSAAHGNEGGEKI